MNKIRIFVWYLKRPNLYKQMVRAIFRVVLKKLSISSGRDDLNIGDATSWCEKKRIPFQKALAQLSISCEVVDVKNAFKEDFEYAFQKEKDCPVKMGGPGSLDLLYLLSKRKNIQKIVETGVAYGWSSLAILLAIKEKKDAVLYSIDMPYVGKNNDKYVGCVVPEHLHEKWRLIRKPDRDGLPIALKKLGRIDLCHYDSDKSYTGKMWALYLLWESLSLGGYLICDDISDNLAFKDFCTSIDKIPVIVSAPRTKSGIKYVGILQKDQ